MMTLEDTNDLQKHFPTFTGEKPHFCEVYNKKLNLNEKQFKEASPDIYRLNPPVSEMFIKRFSLKDGLKKHFETHDCDKSLLPKYARMNFYKNSTLKDIA